ncbi:MAG: DUF5320 domain-containing protein [archaeon]
MPNKDRTGPLGQGVQTGRGLGPCGGGMRKGLGRGFGRGLGLRCNRLVPLTEAEEKKVVETDLKELDLEKQEIEKRLKEMN